MSGLAAQHPWYTNADDYARGRNAGQIIGIEEKQVKRLHILEMPQMHGKPADSPMVHVVWEPHEYSSWDLSPSPTGDRLFVRNYTGEHRLMGGADPNLPSSYHNVEKIIYVLMPGTFLKAWVEDVAVQPDPVPDEFRLNDQFGSISDLTFERAQPGHDGFSEDDRTITGEAEVIKVEYPGTEGSERVEPLDQQTQVIQPVTDRSVRKEWIVDLDDTKPTQSLRQEPRKLDWETLQQPLVVPPDITFFNGDPEEVTDRKE